jgi:PAS domain S-box-containing protein
LAAKNNPQGRKRPLKKPAKGPDRPRLPEHAIRESEEKYRTILNSIEEGYYEVDLAGNLMFFNDSLCDILGYTRDELTGMNNRQYMDAQTSKKVYKTFNEVYQTGKATKAFDWELIRKDGGKRTLETSVSLIRGSGGEPIGFYGIGRDITERKQAEEQLRLHQQQLMQASKMVALGTLVSSVAHEINNPNNFIMLNAPLLYEAWQSIIPLLEEYYQSNGDFLIGGLSFAEMRERIPSLYSGVMNGSKRIKQIVEDLKAFVRKDTSDVDQWVDVNAILRSSISLLSNMIMKSTNRFSIHYGQGLPRMKGNFQRLEQVLINLIQNSCQALPHPRKGIFVSTSYQEETRTLVVRIQDEGAGIPAEVLSRITEPFFTTKRDSGGLGLGLSISSKIVKEHGGTMTFTSELGKGTLAELNLPAVRPPMEQRR